MLLQICASLALVSLTFSQTTTTASTTTATTPSTTAPNAKVIRLPSNSPLLSKLLGGRLSSILSTARLLKSPRVVYASSSNGCGNNCGSYSPYTQAVISPCGGRGCGWPAAYPFASSLPNNFYSNVNSLPPSARPVPVFAIADPIVTKNGLIRPVPSPPSASGTFPISVLHNAPPGLPNNFCNNGNCGK